MCSILEVGTPSLKMEKRLVTAVLISIVFIAILQWAAPKLFPELAPKPAKPAVTSTASGARPSPGSPATATATAPTSTTAPAASVTSTTASSPVAPVTAAPLKPPTAGISATRHGTAAASPQHRAPSCDAELS